MRLLQLLVFALALCSARAAIAQEPCDTEGDFCEYESGNLKLEGYLIKNEFRDCENPERSVPRDRLRKTNGQCPDGGDGPANGSVAVEVLGVSPSTTSLRVLIGPREWRNRKGTIDTHKFPFVTPRAGSFHYLPRQVGTTLLAALRPY